MVIKILGKGEIQTAKFNAAVDELDKVQLEAVAQIKVALDHLIEIDYLYAIRDYIDQLLRDWEETEIDEEEDNDE